MHNKHLPLKESSILIISQPASSGDLATCLHLPQANAENTVRAGGDGRTQGTGRPRPRTSSSSFPFLLLLFPSFFLLHPQLQSQRQYKRLLTQRQPTPQANPVFCHTQQRPGSRVNNLHILNTSPIMSAPTENVSTNGVAPETQQPAADSQTPSAPAEPNAKVGYLVEAGEIGKGRCSVRRRISSKWLTILLGLFWQDRSRRMFFPSLFFNSIMSISC